VVHRPETFYFVSMPAGRPPSLTPEKQERVAELMFLAFDDEQIALMVGVSSKTIQKARLGELFPAIKKSALQREEGFRRCVWNSKQLPIGVCWMLERKYPQQFARPEIQLSYTSNYTQNNLSINISTAEAKAIEAAAEPVRQNVKAMFEKYRPQAAEPALRQMTSVPIPELTDGEARSEA
jgi:hypothetical protein